MAGTTTITRAVGGMPPASSRRGRSEGLTDSLISRLTTATTASDAGSSMSSATNTVPSCVGQPADSQPGWCSSAATSSSVPTSRAPR